MSVLDIWLQHKQNPTAMRKWCELNVHVLMSEQMNKEIGRK